MQSREVECRLQRAEAFVAAVVVVVFVAVVIVVVVIVVVEDYRPMGFSPL